MDIPTAPELVAAAMEKQKIAGPTALARLMGAGPWSAQKVTRWIGGENEPNYEATVTLLGLAGWLKVPAAFTPSARALDAAAETEQEARGLREAGRKRPPVRKRASD